MEITSEQIGLFLQIGGILIVLLSQIVFLYRARKKYGSLKKAFLKMVFPRWAPDEEKFRKLSGKELSEYAKTKFPLAEWLYDDLWITAIGLIVTLIGLFFELFSLTLTV